MCTRLFTVPWWPDKAFPRQTPLMIMLAIRCCLCQTKSLEALTVKALGSHLGSF